MSTPQEPNPFAPPSTDIESAGAPAAAAVEAAHLATRAQRLLGSIVDNLLILVATAPAYLGVAWGDFVKSRRTDTNPIRLFREAGGWGVLAGALVLGVCVLNWTLLTRRGQTLGKIAAGTRVVMLDGSRAPFSKVVALRALAFQAPSYIPGLNKLSGLLGLVDVLFIFRADQRCLHDHLAGTKVIRVHAERA